MANVPNQWAIFPDASDEIAVYFFSADTCMVEIQTGSTVDAGTDAKIQLTICGENGGTIEKILKNTGNRFKQNS